MFHYLFNGIANGKISSLTHIGGFIDVAKYGYLGVEFFFMISGYVIFFSSQNRSASEFAVSRAVRLYPAFWAGLIFTSIIATFWGGQLMSVTVPQVLANLTMVPRWFGYDFVDGVYWTLTYELSFYCMVFAILLFGQARRLNMFFIGWPFLIALCAPLRLDVYVSLLGGYYSYFAAGALLAMLKEKCTAWTAAAMLLCFVNCLVFSAGRGMKIVPGHHFSPVVIITVITIFFLFFLLANTPRGLALQLPYAKLLGALTYPIYLIHAHFGYMVLSRFATDDNKLVLMAMLVLILLALSYAIHVVIERRYAAMWRNHAEATIGRLAAWASIKLKPA